MLIFLRFEVAGEVYWVPRLAALPNRFQQKQVHRIMLIAELQAQHVFPAGKFWIHDISFPAGKFCRDFWRKIVGSSFEPFIFHFPGDQTFVF